MKQFIKLALVALVSTFVIKPAPINTRGVPVEAKASIETHKAEPLVQTQAVTPPVAPEPIKPPAPEVLTNKQVLMQQAGIPRSDWEATNYIVSNESSWRHTAVNPSSGATGLCQALPASKMASAGADYRTNPVTQLRWCHQYAHSRYGGWWSAFAFWQSAKWW